MIDKLRKHQFKFLNYLFEDMYPVKSKYYPDSTFFKKDGKVTLEMEKSGTLWVLYLVWSDISDMFSLDYNETQQLIKEWMEKQIKLQEVEPIQNASFIRMEALEQNSIQESIKSEEVTPSVGKLYVSDLMEEQLKSAEITPLQGCVSPFSMDGKELTPQQMNYVIIGGIEEELEPVEITPDIKGHSGSYWVESQLKLEEVTPKQAVFPIEYPKEITPEESIPLQSWRDLEKKEITPRNAIAPPSSWRGLDSVKIVPLTMKGNRLMGVEEELKSVKYIEINPNPTLTTYHLKVVEEQLKSEEITPRAVVSGSFDLVQDQIIPEKTTCFIDSVRWKKMNN